MRKPLLALSFAVSAGLGVTPVAGALAASPESSNHPGTTPKTTPLTSSIPSAPSRNNAVSGAQIVQTALRYIGFPYTTVGNSPSTGFSCIGLVSFVYRSNGISLPGDLGNALSYAPQVPFSNLLPGDILYFQNTVWNGLSHAAIYIGGGKFVHAEWYNRGVRVSSFNNDSLDGNYWIGKYLGANRPWAGAAVSPVVTTPPIGATNPLKPGATAQKIVSGGPQAAVTVPSLNVRVSPKKGASVRQVIQQGTNLVVLARKGSGWVKVQLPDGSIGWVVAEGLGLGTAVAPTVQQIANPTIGTTTAPTQQGIKTTSRPRGSTSAKVNSLRVHSSPSLDSPVVSTAYQGQKMQVVGRSNGWIKVRMVDGTVGWVKASLTTSARKPAAPPAPPVYNSVAPKQTVLKNRSFTRGPTLTASVRLHAGPAMNSAVVGMVGQGSHVHVLAFKRGWVLVRLSSGQIGYVSGMYLR